MRKSARVSEKRVSPGLPGLQVATRRVIVCFREPLNAPFLQPHHEPKLPKYYREEQLVPCFLHKTLHGLVLLSAQLIDRRKHIVLARGLPLFSWSAVFPYLVGQRSPASWGIVVGHLRLSFVVWFL